MMHPEEELRRGLGHLQAAECFYETSLFPELEYTLEALSGLVELLFAQQRLTGLPQSLFRA